MKNKMKHITGFAILAIFLFVGCGGGNGEDQASQKTSGQKSTEGLTAFEQKHGIGPVTEEITLGDVDQALAEKGEAIFETKCSACHKMNERYVGPELGDVLDNRSPTYVMNMILNPDEMVKKHPEAKKRLTEFMTPMPNQNLKREEARAVVEYLSSVNKQQKGTN